MTAFPLKILAMLTMVCDHVATFFGFYDITGEPVVVLMRSIGRCAFLSYAFLIAEGFRHLKDRPERMKAHLLKLSLLLVVSEIPYDYFEHRQWSVPSDQSVMFTLLLGLLTLSLVYLYRNHTAKKLLILFCSAAVSFFIRTNFRFAGVLLIAAFWFYLERMDQWSYVKRLLCLLLIITIYIPVYTWARADFGGWGAFSELFVASLPWYAVHYLMMFVLASYNGRQSTRSRTFQAIYSWFYPAHLIVLAIARFFAG